MYVVYILSHIERTTNSYKYFLIGKKINICTMENIHMDLNNLNMTLLNQN